MVPATAATDREPFDAAGARTLLVFLVICHLAEAAWIIAVDRSWPYLMTHQLYIDAVRLDGALQSPDLSWYGRTPAGQWPLVQVTHPWPPLNPISTHLVGRLFGELSRHAAAVAVLPWVAVLLLATYRLGRQLAGRRTGLLAALLVGCYPIVLGHRTMATPFLPFAAQVAALAGAVRNLRARPTRCARLEVGLWAGLALITRIEAPVHVAVIVAVTLLGCADAAGRRALARNLLGPAVLAIAVGGWWYLPNGWGSLYFYRTQGLLASEVPQDKVVLGTLANLFYYPARLVQVQLGLPMAALAAGSAVYAVRRRVPGGRYLVAWIALAWVFYLLVPMKGGRYALALLPPLAVCTAVAARHVAQRGARWLEPAVAVLALGTWIALVHGPAVETWYPAAGHRPERWGPSFALYEDALDVGRLRPWTSPAWDEPIERLVSAIDRYAAAHGADGLTVSIAGEIGEYVDPILQLRRLRKVEPPLFGFVPPPYPDRLAEYVRDLAQVDLLVMAPDYESTELAHRLSGGPSRPLERNHLKTYAMMRAARGRIQLAEVVLPDGARAVLLGRP